MSANQIVEQLKQNNQDFEWYPTTDKMLNVVIDDIISRDRSISLLDIGCGTARLKTLLDERLEANKDEYDRQSIYLTKYFGIEKSEILINQLPKDVFILGTDFYETTLIDKIADVIFCNPPYSDYETWVERILREGNFKYAYLVIPQRWKDNKDIQQALEDGKIEAEVLASDDFTTADRQARAKIDIVRFRKKGYESWHDVSDEQTFKTWFDKTFQVSSDEDRVMEWERQDKHKKELKNEIAVSKNKLQLMIESYNAEMNKMFNTFSQLCSLDEEVLKDVGVDFNKVRESLKQKIKSHKILYWDLLFEELEEITSRLTAASRDSLKKQFAELSCVDFTESNARSVVIWVLKHAKDYYDSQLVDLYKTLSCFDNVIKYKSNQRVFSKDDWGYYKKENQTHYCLTYRMVVDTLYFRESKSRWNPSKGAYVDDYEVCDYKAHTIVNDLCAIANNLGFTVGSKEVADCFGEKFYIYDNNGKQLIEYKLYKNGNTHIKMDLELMKAINVEVARLLGWIRDKSDIRMEFPDELAEGADKYFGGNFSNRIATNNIKLLGVF